MKYLRRHSRLVLVALGLLIALTPVDAVGQPPAREGVTDIFLPAPRGLRQQLARATKALEEERFSEAVDLLGQLLADSPAAEPPAGQGEQDYFLSGSEVTGTRLSLKAEAQRLLGSMPDKGRDLYELKFGADARQLLDRAVEAQEFPQLIEVTRRYFHTNAGYEATMLISRHYLDQGRPLAAALRLQRLVSSTTARKLYEPELSVLLATCWLLADMPERARETLVNLKASEPQATLRIGDKDVSLFENEDKALSWLVDVIGAGFTPAGVEATEWVMFRGDAARNAESAGGSPLLTARWRVQTANHPTDEQMIRQRQAQYRDQGIPVLPSLHPLAVSNVILMRSPRMLLAVDIETGKRIWNFPWFDDPDGESLENDRIRPDQRVPNPQTMELNRRVWDDAPYGQMSSDGNQVFLIWGLSSDTQQPLVQIFGGRPRPNAQGASEYNKLVALDLKAQGKLRWIVGDEDGTDEPKLAGAFFLGAPLPADGTIVRAGRGKQRDSVGRARCRHGSPRVVPAVGARRYAQYRGRPDSSFGRRLAVLFGRSAGLPDFRRSGRGSRPFDALAAVGIPVSYLQSAHEAGYGDVPLRHAPSWRALGGCQCDHRGGTRAADARGVGSALLPRLAFGQAGLGTQTSQRAHLHRLRHERQGRHGGHGGTAGHCPVGRIGRLDDADCGGHAERQRDVGGERLLPPHHGRPSPQNRRQQWRGDRGHPDGTCAR